MENIDDIMSTLVVSERLLLDSLCERLNGTVEKTRGPTSFGWTASLEGDAPTSSEFLSLVPAEDHRLLRTTTIISVAFCSSLVPLTHRLCPMCACLLCVLTMQLEVVDLTALREVLSQFTASGS